MSIIVESPVDVLLTSLGILFVIAVLLLAWRSTLVQERPLVRAVVVLDTVQGLPSDLASTIHTLSLAQPDETEAAAVRPEASGLPVGVGIGAAMDGAQTSPEHTTHDHGREEKQGSGGNTEKSGESSHEDGIEAVGVSGTGEEEEEEIGEGEVGERELHTGVEEEEVGEVEEIGEEEQELHLEEGCIFIRLIFLNDTRKLVQGRLQERLGEFKRRNFPLELAANKLVRLIFNGHVLHSDSETLEHYGLFHNCVLHCVVHQPRQPERLEAPGQADATYDLDFGNILFLVLGIMLGFAWYCHLQYSQYFTGTSTIALVGLSGFFVVSIIGLYFPDWEGFR